MKIDILKAKEYFEKNIVSPINTVKSTRRGPPYIILWNGQQIKLRNGKCVWPSLGAAKTALRGKVGEEFLAKTVIIDFDFSKINKLIYSEYIDGNYVRECYQVVLEELQENGILEFKPIL